MRMMKETGDGSDEVRRLLLTGSTCCSHPSQNNNTIIINNNTTTTTRTTTSTPNPEVVKKHQHKHNLKHRYEVMETLGKGTYGTVKKAVERSTRNTVAIKSIRKERVTEDLDRVHIQRELEITASLRHPNIIRFFEVFEGRDKIVIVMEYASRGELYDYNGVVHRDLKLENILLDRDLNVKLADFGLSNRYQKHSHLQTFCGSPLYASPEIVRGLPYLGPEPCHSHATDHPRTLPQAQPPLRCLRPHRLAAGRTAGRAATVEDVANHWWVNWGYDQSVCDCPSAPHQDCPSPLLARYIDWQNRVAASNNASSSSSSSQPSPHPISFSFPLKGERGCGGAAAEGSGRPTRAATSSSLRKSRKENAIPQTGPCGAPSVPAVVTPIAAAATAVPVSSSSTAERRKPKGILKPQRSFDSSSSFLLSPANNGSPLGRDA
ncbi:hypothetical protein CRUP_034093 [Coryphaenoides rupestris]|nr:hypothetical protein CRUP_034093 [Coryphaenoides rupestris]